MRLEELNQSSGYAFVSISDLYRRDTNEQTIQCTGINHYRIDHSLRDYCEYFFSLKEKDLKIDRQCLYSGVSIKGYQLLSEQLTHIGTIVAGIKILYPNVWNGISQEPYGYIVQSTRSLKLV